jgi:hypothetical protein
MKLSYAYLAEKAERLQDGRLCVFGADIDIIEVPQVPFPFMATMVVRFSVAPDEPLEDHTISVDLILPEGERKSLVKQMAVNTMRNQADPSLPSAASILAQLGIVFGAPGLYRFNIFADGDEVISLPLSIHVAEETTNVPSPSGESASEQAAQHRAGSND